MINHRICHTNFNKSKTLILISKVCKSILLIVGEAIDSSPWSYCIGQGPCPNKDQDCSVLCVKMNFPNGGKCNGNQCCCDG